MEKVEFIRNIIQNLVSFTLFRNAYTDSFRAPDNFHYKFLVHFFTATTDHWSRRNGIDEADGNTQKIEGLIVFKSHYFLLKN